MDLGFGYPLKVPNRNVGPVWERLLRYLSQTVSQGFDHDAAVIVPLGLELLTQLFSSKYPHSKHPHVVVYTAVHGRHEVRKAEVRLSAGAIFFCLQREQRRSARRPLVNTWTLSVP